MGKDEHKFENENNTIACQNLSLEYTVNIIRPCSFGICMYFTSKDVFFRKIKCMILNPG